MYTFLYSSVPCSFLYIFVGPPREVKKKDKHTKNIKYIEPVQHGNNFKRRTMLTITTTAAHSATSSALFLRFWLLVLLATSSGKYCHTGWWFDIEFLLGIICMALRNFFFLLLFQLLSFVFLNNFEHVLLPYSYHKYISATHSLTYIDTQTVSNLTFRSFSHTTSFG